MQTNVWPLLLIVLSLLLWSLSGFTWLVVAGAALSWLLEQFGPFSGLGNVQNSLDRLAAALPPMRALLLLLATVGSTAAAIRLWRKATAVQSAA